MTVRSIGWAHNLLESSNFNCQNNSHNLQSFSEQLKIYGYVHNNNNNIANH